MNRFDLNDDVGSSSRSGPMCRCAMNNNFNFIHMVSKRGARVIWSMLMILSCGLTTPVLIRFKLVFCVLQNKGNNLGLEPHQSTSPNFNFGVNYIFSYMCFKSHASMSRMRYSKRMGLKAFRQSSLHERFYTYMALVQRSHITQRYSTVRDPPLRDDRLLTSQTQVRSHARVSLRLLGNDVRITNTRTPKHATHLSESERHSVSCATRYTQALDHVKDIWTYECQNTHNCYFMSKGFRFLKQTCVFCRARLRR